jgi:PD-(D/E)XK endonuclease
MRIQDTVFRTCKEQGEWAELCFMTKAAGMGLKVLRPFGDSSSYDVGVECPDRILRVQVKSTNYERPGTRSYGLALHGSKIQQYAKGTIDFFAIYLIPADIWYILPFETTGKSVSLHFTPGSKRDKHAKYREAWDLLGAAPTLSSQALS